MQMPVQVPNKCWIIRRTCGRVTTGRCGATFLPPHLLLKQECVGTHGQCHMSVPPQPGTTLELVQSHILFEVLVASLKPPADLTQADQVFQRGIHGEVRDPVVRWRLLWMANRLWDRRAV